MTAAPLNNEYAKRLQRQNAKRLHEAAPALLAACKDCMENRGDWAASMAAAIAKAEGRS